MDNRAGARAFTPEHGAVIGMEDDEMADVVSDVDLRPAAATAGIGDIPAPCAPVVMHGALGPPPGPARDQPWPAAGS